MAAVKVRSPNYPAIDLGAAVELTRKLYDHAQRIALPMGEVVAKYWQLKPGGYADQCVGAVRSYGLVEVDGQGDGRKLRVTTEAARILDETPERAELLRRAALLPRVHRSVWSQFSPDGKLPADSVIGHFLVHDYDPPFNRDRVGAFIKQFRKTISFAGIGEADIIEPAPEDEESTLAAFAASGEGEKPKKPKPRPGMTQDLFTLPEGEVSIQLPARLSPRSLQHFKAWVGLVLAKVEDASAADEGEPPAES